MENNEDDIILGFISKLLEKYNYIDEDAKKKHKAKIKHFIIFLKDIKETIEESKKHFFVYDYSSNEKNIIILNKNKWKLNDNSIIYFFINEEISKLMNCLDRGETHKKRLKYFNILDFLMDELNIIIMKKSWERL